VLALQDRPPVPAAIQSSGVPVKEAGSDGAASRFIYPTRADAIHQTVAGDTSDAALRSAILRVIEPIAGEVTLERYQAVRDARGRIVAYDAWITR